MFDFSAIPIGVRMDAKNRSYKFHNLGNSIPILKVDTFMSS